VPLPRQEPRDRVQPANNFLAIHRASLARCGPSTSDPATAPSNSTISARAVVFQTRPTKSRSATKGVTEIVKMSGRGHALTIDAGWREVAEKVLEFAKRFA
jgi:hypothetical protein